MNKSIDGLAFLDNLPVNAVLGDIVKTAECGPLVVAAPPGSGKTLLVPPAVHDMLRPGERLVLSPATTVCSTSHREAVGDSS